MGTEEADASTLLLTCRCQSLWEKERSNLPCPSPKSSLWVATRLMRKALARGRQVQRTLTTGKARPVDSHGEALSKVAGLGDTADYQPLPGKRPDSGRWPYLR